MVALMALATYKDSIVAGNTDRADVCWHILIGLGCVPCVIALYFRFTIQEAPRFTMDIDRDVRRAAMDISNVLGPKSNSAGIDWVDPGTDSVSCAACILTPPQPV